MAGAIIGLAAPLLIPEGIKLVAKLLDKIFPPKTGPAKANVLDEFLAALQAGLQNSKVPITPLTGEQIRNTNQQIVDQLNAAGELKGAATAITSPTLDAGIDAVLADLLIITGRLLKARTGQ